jgi:hypothetical protein
MPQRNYYDANGRLHSGKTGKYIKENRRNTINATVGLPQQQGGFLPAIPAALLTAYTIGQKIKPATKLQEGLNNTQFGQTTPGKIISNILDVPRFFGLGEEEMARGGARPRHKKIQL